MTQLARYFGMLGCALLVSACATSTNSSLEQARSSYETTKRDPSAARVAPVALRNAKKNIDRAQTEFGDGDEAATTHYAKLAQRHVQIAQEQAEQARLQKQVDQASERRRELRLRAQQEQAINAQRQAASATQQANAARARAEKLERELRELQAKRTERGIVLTLGDVLFDYNKANLRPGGLQTVEKLAAFMQEYPERRVRIEGHTDSIGSDAYNKELSERRALSVNSALIAQGIDPSRITAVGLGEAYPKATNNTEAGRQQNRRVEIVISDEQGNIQSR